MKKYFVISLIFHLLPLLYVLFLQPSPEMDEQQASNKQEQNLQISEIEVIEQVPGDMKEPEKDDRKFYWGIGIAIGSTLVELPGMGHVNAIQVESVYGGYTAESAGVLKGDVIFLINGVPVSYNNDIVGDGPKKLLLTIYRNNAIVRLQLERCKVYY